MSSQSSNTLSDYNETPGKWYTRDSHSSDENNDPKIEKSNVSQKPSRSSTKGSSTRRRTSSFHESIPTNPRTAKHHREENKLVKDSYHTTPDAPAGPLDKSSKYIKQVRLPDWDGRNKKVAPSISETTSLSSSSFKESLTDEEEDHSSLSHHKHRYVARDHSTLDYPKYYALTELAKMNSADFSSLRNRSTGSQESSHSPVSYTSRWTTDASVVAPVTNTQRFSDEFALRPPEFAQDVNDLSDSPLESLKIADLPISSKNPTMNNLLGEQGDEGDTEEDSIDAQVSEIIRRVNKNLEKFPASVHQRQMRLDVDKIASKNFKGEIQGESPEKTLKSPYLSRKFDTSFSLDAAIEKQIPSGRRDMLERDIKNAERLQAVATGVGVRSAQHTEEIVPSPRTPQHLSINRGFMQEFLGQSADILDDQAHPQDFEQSRTSRTHRQL